jgi:sterol desaturase/sphingolipid hydroxylase (fatty acid hydroxylase superfamily)
VYTLLKSQAGSWPEPKFPRGIDLALEASRSRRRMLPVTVVYPTYLLVLLLLAWRAGELAPALAFLALGLLAWTLVEYLVHRYILHVAFPKRGGVLRRALHHLFDASHADHHAQPFDGYHINGHVDTLWVAVLAFPLSFLAPPFTASLFVAGVFFAYLVEEWAHHAMHFENYRWGYFQYVRRRHLYHHSKLGVGTAYGITSDFWDKVFGTRIPASKRERMSERWPRGAPPSVGVRADRGAPPSAAHEPASP